VWLARSAVELRLPGLRQHVAPQPHVLQVGEAGHRRRVAVDGKLQGAAASDVEMLDGWLRLKSDPSRVVRVSEVMRCNGLTEITETFEAHHAEERGKYATLMYGAQFVEDDDTMVNPLGIKGMGELGMVGIPAAIANAVFHATGRRIRELPITLDKLLGELHAVA
jgi:CO/xanthine dehydrogenase Mo-binding subunit